VLCSFQGALDPLIVQFGHNEIETAANGIQHISMLVESMRAGQGGLYERAHQAIEEARRAQVTTSKRQVLPLATPAAAHCCCGAAKDSNSNAGC
jgi:hypothetical protein